MPVRKPTRPLTLAAVLAVALAAVEVLSIFLAGVPAGVGIAFGVLFAVAHLLIRRESNGGLVLFGVLCLIEVIGFFGYKRGGAAEWTLQVLAFVLGLAGLLVTLVIARGRRSARAPRTG